MTDKQYKCLNGDLIEVGKEYKDIHDNDPVKVVGFDGDKIIVNYDFGLTSYEAYDEDEFQSLWQEQPDKDEDKIIKKLTIQTEYEQLEYTKPLSLTEVKSIFDWLGKKHSIVEDKQEPEESLEDRFTELQLQMTKLSDVVIQLQKRMYDSRSNN